MENKSFNVLFLCTGNSARSIMAEVLLRRFGAGHFQAYSAGSHPAGAVNPFTLEVLEGHGFATEGLRSKSWGEFAQAGVPELDFVFTVCDKAAGEVCPVWPGQPITAHWGFEDPVSFDGSEEGKRRQFEKVFKEISTRIQLFVNLPFDKLDRLKLEKAVRDLAEGRA